jgi:preprotein translocase subunit SecE
VARNRQRASERKGRRRAEDEPGNGSGENLHRDDVPGALDHASGDVDEVEASIVAGAHGEPAPLEDDVVLDEEDGDVDDGDDDDGGSPPIRTADGAPAHGRGGPRFLNFLRACWAELQRVQWPDRRAVGQATAVVLGFVVVAGAFLGLIDALAKQVVQLIL